MKAKPVIGLTGPTGAGKSTVAAAFRELGCAVVDADLLARDAVRKPECLNALAEAFGSDILSADGTLDRGLLARRAFSDPTGTKRLNAITHPIIMEETRRRISAYQTGTAAAVVLDAALLFESGADSVCSTTVAVVAPPESRLRRIMKRDGITEEQARERMNAQNPNEYYIERAACVFDGRTGFDALHGEAACLLKKILGERNETL